MKALLKKFLAAKGLMLIRRDHFDIIPKGNPKYAEAVSSLYALMRDSVLPSLPALTEKRIRNLTSLEGLPVPQAVYVIDLLRQTAMLEGAVCEMGVAGGCTSRLLAAEIIGSNKDLWLFDSFAGLPKPTEEDCLINDIFRLGSMEAYAGTMKHPRSLVERKLRDMPFPTDRVHIIEGFFNETSSQNLNLRKCSFAFVDFDLYKPILDALNFLKTILVLGAHIVVHDYGFFSSGAQRAVDQFVVQNGAEFEVSFPHEIAKGIAILKKRDRQVRL